MHIADKPRARQTPYGWRVTRCTDNVYVHGIGRTLEEAYHSHAFHALTVDKYYPFCSMAYRPVTHPLEGLVTLPDYIPHPWYKQLYYTVRYSEWICKFLRR